jgi:hypothetical protein
MAFELAVEPLADQICDRASRVSTTVVHDRSARDSGKTSAAPRSRRPRLPSSTFTAIQCSPTFLRCRYICISEVAAYLSSRRMASRSARSEKFQRIRAVEHGRIAVIAYGSSGPLTNRCRPEPTGAQTVDQLRLKVLGVAAVTERGATATLEIQRGCLNEGDPTAVGDSGRPPPRLPRFGWGPGRYLADAMFSPSQAIVL